MARVVRRDDNAFHKSARGNMTECGKSEARRPRPGELEGRRLVPCPQCYAQKGQAKADRDARKRADRDDRHELAMVELRPVVLARAGYRCERCGSRRFLDCHHRLMRSQGGPDTLENLVALCGPGNTAGCHGWVHQHPEQAYALGLLIRQSSGPPAEPWEPPPGEYGADFWGSLGSG